MDYKFQNLLELSDESWYRYLLSKDLMFQRVDPRCIPSLIQNSVNCGVDEARYITQKVGTDDINTLYDFWGTIIEESEDSGSFGIYYLSIFEPDNLVRLFVNRIRLVEEIIVSNTGTFSLKPADVKNLLLAHELFHICEHRNPGLFTEQYRTTLWKFGPLSQHAKIRALSEIGATAFAKKLCAVEYNPLILNYALLLSVAPQSAEKLFESVVSTSTAINRDSH